MQGFLHQALRVIFPGRLVENGNRAVVLACIDSRFVADIYWWCERNLGHQKYYLILVGGGALSAPRVIDHEIDLAVRKAGANGGIFLFVHEDCKAFRENGLCDADGRKVLQETETRCIEQFPGINCSTWVMHLDHRVTEVSVVTDQILV